MQHISKRNLLWIWLIGTLIIGISLVNETRSDPAAIFAAPTLLDATKTPGSTFSINVTVADIEGLFGWNFRLHYNTTVLTAIGNASYPPFTAKAFAAINDTEGYIYLSYTYPPPETVGFSTVEPKPIARIDFRVDSLGTSVFSFTSVTLASVPPPVAIPYEVHNGFFANIAVDLHDIAITGITVSPTSLTINGTVTVIVTIENQGDFDETFDVSAYYNTTLIQTQTGITLAPGTNTQRTFTWRATVAGTYIMKAVATTVTGETDTANNIRTAADRVKVGTTQDGGWPPFILYVGAGIAIVVIIAVVILVLRMRKPKP